MSLFCLVVYLVGLNTYNKLHFLRYMLTRVSHFTSDDGTALKMKTEKIFKQEKMLKFTEFCNF